MVTVTDTAPIAGQNDEREQKSMSRETYETYSAAEPEKIDLIAFLAEYFQAFQKFFFGVLALVILAGGGSFLTAKLRYQPVYEAYTSFVVGSNRAVGYSYYDNVTAEQLGKDLSVSRDKRRTEGCCSAGSWNRGGDIRNSGERDGKYQSFYYPCAGRITGDGVSGDEIRYHELSGGGRVYHWCDDTDGGG